VVARLLDVTAKLDGEGEALYRVAVLPAPLDPAQPACLDFGIRFAELACRVADGGRDIRGRRLQQPLAMRHWRGFGHGRKVCNACRKTRAVVSPPGRRPTIRQEVSDARPV